MEESARSLRNTLRQHQSEASHLSLLHSLGAGCFQAGWSPALAGNMLHTLGANLGISDGFIASLEGNHLEVVASIGDSYPKASRIPMMGKIAGALKTPCSFAITPNLQAVSPHAMHQASMTMPIAFNSHPLGVLVLSSAAHAITSDQTQLIETLCGLLGAILHQNTHQAAAVDQTIIDVLTPREREVFALLPSGKSNAKLGEMLGIAPGTVKIHVERILSKLNLNDRTQAAVKAVELGFSSSDDF